MFGVMRVAAVGFGVLGPLRRRLHLGGQRGDLGNQGGDVGGVIADLLT